VSDVIAMGLLVFKNFLWGDLNDAAMHSWPRSGLVKGFLEEFYRNLTGILREFRTSSMHGFLILSSIRNFS
jgi:hypothetical protein